MNALHPLGQLIQSVEDSKGWTVREIARRIERAGLNLSNAYLGRLKRQPLRSITYETIHALATGLELPQRTVAVAALETMGVHDLKSTEAGTAVAIARDPDLSERDRRILLAVVREMQGEHSRDATETTEPAATAGSSPLEDSAQPDGIKPLNAQAAARAKWDRIRREAFDARDANPRPSDGRPRLLDDSVDEDILELPYAADDSEDPGEDND